MPLDELVGGCSEVRPAVDGVAIKQDTPLQRADLIGAEVHAHADTLEHLSQVADVVFGLDEETLQGPNRGDAKGAAPERPDQGQLHGEGRLADTGLPDDEQTAAPAQPALPQHAVGIRADVVGCKLIRVQRRGQAESFVVTRWSIEIKAWSFWDNASRI